ncbi:hypothetical protein KI387_041323, partial [Taxus chinensis]
MGLTSEGELKMQLYRLGKMLDPPPLSRDGLLNILEEAANCLSMVKQSDYQVVSFAMNSLMNHLASPRFLRHSSTDVRLVVVTCISEIMRIKAPEPPYSDNIMKEIFQLMVESFKGLGDTTSALFANWATIMEIMVNIRSWVLMVDLECYELIFQMFDNFFTTIHKDHAEIVVSSMQTIMSSILNEEDDILMPLLMILFAYMRKEEREVSPATEALARGMIDQCKEKLRPYLTNDELASSEPSNVDPQDIMQDKDFLLEKDVHLFFDDCICDSEVSEEWIKDLKPKEEIKSDPQEGKESLVVEATIPGDNVGNRFEYEEGISELRHSGKWDNSHDNIS